ncbi:MAG: response regulator [Anditalea sp.]
MNIINDILDFSKIEAGKLELDIDKCDIYELVSQTVDIVSFGAHNKGLEMLLNITQDLPRFLYVDEIRIKQILINLLGNAIKFTHQGEIELKISQLSCSREGHSTYRFEVRDTGIGIAENKQTKIFEAFSQEDGSITKKHGGTGLGLSISNKLLALMGSHLELISLPGKGSTFFFDLPLRSEDEEAINSLNFGLIKKVLVVDDNDHSRSIIMDMLSCEHREVHEANNGYEALLQIGANRDYDVTLVDYQMPYMNGLETIKKIKKVFNPMDENSFILMHNASDHELILEACEELDIKHHLVKPIKLDDLFHAFSHIREEINPKKKPTEQAGDKLDPGSYKVLIAEDNPTNMLLARIIIERIAPNVVIIEAYNGLEALHYCQKESPSIAFMDIQMPVMNGFEAAKKILKLPHCANVPIIALSAGNVKGEREKSLKAGMVDFIPKPIVEDTFKMALDKWVDKNKILPSLGYQEPSVQEFEDRTLEHLNVGKIKEYLGDDPIVIKEILHLTLVELNETSLRFNSFLSQKNIKGLKEAGHKLKGSSMIAGLNKLVEISRSFEDLEKFEKDKVSALMDDLLEEKDLVIGLIHEYLGRNS